VILSHGDQVDILVRALHSPTRGISRRKHITSLALMPADLRGTFDVNVPALRGVLALTENLVELDFRGAKSDAREVLTGKVDYPFRLRTFGTDQSLEGLDTFLASQSTITTLLHRGWSYVPDPSAIDFGSTLSSLQRVAGNPALLTTLIPGRPVSKVDAYIEKEEDAVGLAESIAQSSVPVRALAVHLLCILTADLLRTLTAWDALDEVEELELMHKYTPPHHAWLSGLAGAPRLRSLICRPLFVNLIAADDLHTLLQKSPRICPALEHLRIESIGGGDVVDYLYMGGEVGWAMERSLAFGKKMAQYHAVIVKPRHPLVTT